MLEGVLEVRDGYHLYILSEEGAKLLHTIFPRSNFQELLRFYRSNDYICISPSQFGEIREYIIKNFDEKIERGKLC